VLAVAVDFGDRDLREAMLGEEGQQVVAQLPGVVRQGRGGEPFIAQRVQPVRGELVEADVGAGGERIRG
jgi:hypothetical protein